MSVLPDSFTAIRATYRLQFHHEFTFRDATELVPYLAALGISHIYASPIMEARPVRLTAMTSSTTISSTLRSAARRISDL